MTHKEFKQLNEQERREARIDLWVGIVSLAAMLSMMIILTLNMLTL